MAVKRDRVNRVQGIVYLPIDGSRCIVGEVVTLRHVVEKNIDTPWEIDPEVMREPVNGDAVGDAIFDAQLEFADECIFDANMV
jgi:hypothetical protein